MCLKVGKHALINKSVFVIFFEHFMESLRKGKKPICLRISKNVEKICGIVCVN